MSSARLEAGLTEVVELLEASDEGRLANGLRRVLERLAAAVVGEERGLVIRQLLAFFGGPGSLSDLALMRDGKPLRADNERLEALRGLIFGLARDELTG